MNAIRVPAYNGDALELESVACDLCGGLDTRQRYRKPDKRTWVSAYEFPVVECISCGLVFVNPRPTFASMARFYTDSYHEGRDSPRHRRRYQHQLRFLPRLGSQRILDIGCARGDFLSFVLERHADIHAVGVDAFSTEVNDARIEFHGRALTECAFQSDAFDVVTAWAVIEHVHCPSAYFREVHRIVAPGGRFIFLVTNSESLYGRRAYREDVPRHTYHFSPAVLAKYADKVGFVMKRCTFDDDIFDGRGHGTVRWALAHRVGVSWDVVRRRNFTLLQRIAWTTGRIIDDVVFSTRWEALLGRSGIIVVEFEKP